MKEELRRAALNVHRVQSLHHIEVTTQENMQHLHIGQWQWRMNAYVETQCWTQVVEKKGKHAHQTRHPEIYIDD
jgi:hypothetical protein